MKKSAMLAAVIASTLSLSGCIIMPTDKHSLNDIALANPQGTYCEVQQADGGVIIIPNQMAIDSAKVLGKLPSCALLYRTFYTFDERSLEQKRIEQRLQAVEKKVGINAS